MVAFPSIEPGIDGQNFFVFANKEQLKAYHPFNEKEPDAETDRFVLYDPTLYLAPSVEKGTAEEFKVPKQNVDQLYGGSKTFEDIRRETRHVED